MRNLHVATSAVLLLLIAVAGAVWFACSTTRAHLRIADAPSSPSTPDPPRKDDTLSLRTAHYDIISSATLDETNQVAEAAEALRTSWFGFFDGASTSGTARLSLRLYADREEFKRNNRSRPWAEAYYLAPTCHAYYARDHDNAYHWMLHEATHQLNDTALDLRAPRWINEGLASYFGAGRIIDDVLRPENADPHAYPIWWLARIRYSGNLAEDIVARRVVPLRALVTGTGVDINETVNPHYVGFWSLTHFLIHHRNGVHRGAYRQLIRERGSLEAFERLIGPLPSVEAEWYAYLMKQAASVDGQSAAAPAAREAAP